MVESVPWPKNRRRWSASSWGASRTGRRCATPTRCSTRFGVPHECRVVSAHRTPDWLREYAPTAEGRGLEVIIAGAGGAAHLPGMVAAQTMLPVLGVPVQVAGAARARFAAVDRADARRRAGRHAGHRQGRSHERGAAGRQHPGARAGPSCARSSTQFRRRTDRSACWEKRCRDASDLAGRDDRRAGQRPAGPHVRHRRPAHGLSRPYACRPTTTRPPARWPTVEINARLRRSGRGPRVSPSNVDVVTFEFENIPAADGRGRGANCARCGPAATCCTPRSTACARRRFLPSTAFRSRRSCPSARHADLQAALDRARLPGRAENGRLGLRRQGTDASSPRRPKPPRPGKRSAAAKPCSKPWSTSSAKFRSSRPADSTARLADYGVVCQHARQPYSRRHRGPGRSRAANRGAKRARLPHAVLRQLDVVGVLCVEFFLTRDGRLLVNELAPRPHNSGHLTFDACVTSQFEQQLRAICGLPLGSTELLRPAAMANLLGDCWQRRASPTGRPPAGFRTSSCTCTAKTSRGPDARWDT